MQKRIFSAVLGCLSLCMAATAQAECMPSANISEAAGSMPDRSDLPSSNNLARPAGKAIPAMGQPLRLHGRVLDRACKPVIGAVVELWQANTDGVYQVADRAAMNNPYAVFAGAGKTTTDNTGSFDFYTIFPGATLEGNGPRTPHLNLRVRHEHVKPLTTELFFQNEQRNANDPIYAGIGAEANTALTLRMTSYDAGLVGETTLVLDGTVPYVQY